MAKEVANGPGEESGCGSNQMSSLTVVGYYATELVITWDVDLVRGSGMYLRLCV